MSFDSYVGFALGCALTCVVSLVLSGCSRQSESGPSPKAAVTKKIREAAPRKVRSDKNVHENKAQGAERQAEGEQGVAVEDTSSSGGSPTEAEKEAMVGVADQLRDAFDQCAQGGNDPSAFAQLQRTLMAIRPTPFLRAAREMIRHGTVEEKKVALQAVGLRFARNGNVAVQVSDTGEAMQATTAEPDGRDDPSEDVILPGDSAGGEKKVSQEERRAVQSQTIVESVANAFSDADESVRLAAVEAAMALPKEESGILVSRLMSEGDAGLQTALLEALAGSGEPSDLIVSIQALSSENESVASLASRNLKEATGQDFKTEKEAAEWLERTNSNFINSPDSQVGMDESIKQGKKK